MRFLKILFDFYINSSLHVALAVYALSWITLMEFGLDYDENILYFNFYASITGYNFVKFFGLAKFYHRSLANWLKTIQFFSFFCFLFMCYYAIHLEVKTLWFVFFSAILTFFYAIPFLPKKLFYNGKLNLRSVSGLKVYVIALVWVLVTVVLPLINNDYFFGFDAWIMAIQRYLYVLVLILPFDIIDMRYDSLTLSTIPQKIGIHKTKILGLGLLLLFFVLEFFKDEFSMIRTLVLLIISILTGAFLWLCHRDRNRYYSVFWVEGLPIVWLVLLLSLD